jgi:hypothetical protein
MHSYRERLRAPASWWINGMFMMFVFGSIVWFGFPLWVALVTDGTLFAITAAFLVNWGRASIEVTGTELIAGGSQVALGDVGEVRELDEAQARALRGPRADPRAHLLIRPYLHKAVYVEIRATGGAPYWLLFTRRPAKLATAIRGYSQESRPVDHVTRDLTPLDGSGRSDPALRRGGTTHGG